MARGIHIVRNQSHAPVKEPPNEKSDNVLRRESARPPPENESSKFSIPSPQHTPFPLLTNKFMSTPDYSNFRSTSPPPSEDRLQSLDALRLAVNSANGCNGTYTHIPLIHCKHFLEVQDSRHRYGTYLRPYYDVWTSSGSDDSFFTWLDEGEGRSVDASKHFPTRPHCVRREDLDQAVVHYCSKKESEQYRVIVHDRKLVWANENSYSGKGEKVDTGCIDRWIFVIDENGTFFLNKKEKGRFHHSSFVAGRPVRAAGRIIIEKGDIVGIGPNSGHYLTQQDQLLRAIENFLGHAVEQFSAISARSSFVYGSSLGTAIPPLLLDSYT